MILLSGKSGSGKDFLVELFKLKPVISRTTRPQRKNEIDGIHKIFVSNEEFDRYHDSEIVAFTVYDGHRYCALEADIVGKDIYIIDPTGIASIDRRRDFVIVYIKVPLYRRLKRLYKREEENLAMEQLRKNIKITSYNNMYLSIKYAIRRAWHDYINFKEFENEKRYDVLLRS